MSPTVNPSGKGSSGSTTYWAKPVIQAVPLSLGAAIFLIRIAPRNLGIAVSFMIEFLAAIPSIAQ